MVMEDGWTAGGRHFRSRLIVGTGKYETGAIMREAIRQSGAELVTVAVRRVNLDRPDEPSLLDDLELDRITLLPNTAGAHTVDEAVQLARLARAAGLGDLVKLEIIGDDETLWPDPVATVEATARLAADGFVVLPYTSPDPVLARRLVAAGAATVMPLGSPIGSGQGVPDFHMVSIIRQRVSVPVIVDAGIGAPSDAALAMEAGADAVLVNTAIARAQDPPLMAAAMAQAVQAGRSGYLAGRIPRRAYATPSSPVEGQVGRPATGSH